MPLTQKIALSFVAALGLAACGSTTTSTFVNNTPQFTQDQIAYNSASAAVRNAPNSNAAAVAGASGTYTGEAFVQVFGSSPTVSFLGDATLTANIGAGTVSGSMTNFQDGTDQSNAQAATGALTVTGTSIGGSRDSRFVSGVSGTLTSPSNTVILAAGGTLSGDFHNGPTDSLFGSATVNGSTLNGVPGRAVVINVYGNKQ